MVNAFREAWRTIVPGTGQPHGSLPPLLLAMTVVTGLVDAYSYLLLGHTFVANMTGNVVFAGFAIAGSPGFALSAALTALGSFALGAFAAGALGHRLRENRGRMLFLVLLVETLAVGAATVLTGVADTGSYKYVLIVLLGIGMGAQNAVARALAVPDLTTTVLTLTVTGIAADSKLTGGPGSRVGRRLLAMVAMFLGATAGAIAIHSGHETLPLVLTTIILASATGVAAVLSRSDEPWVRPTGQPGK